MALATGENLGPYEILAPLGAGGMGEVYKARDTRLDRSVAIKVLPEHIAHRPEARARFEREARAVASLNHPHICVLHDIGNHDGASYMVMELLEGETLAARIKEGAIPLEQALALATQIADALDRAHRAGVTHRDVKPGNIMLTRDGVKVLDFGLAKSATKPGPNDATLTTEGAVVGTPQYMAPEQFEGREADARSDVWAFDAVVYEMVTGRKAFQGKSYASLVGAIFSADPAPMAVKPFTPAWLERLVSRCLAKDPEDRWQSMRDVVLELRSPAVESAAPAEARFWSWVVAGGLAMALLALSAIHFRETPPEQPVLTTSILPPDKAVFNQTAISPDGKILAFTATAEGKRQLWVRRLHASTAQALAGTEQASYPFWSPDSRWIGFFAEGRLKKIEAAGGPVQTVYDAARGRGGTWNAEGVILFADVSRGLFRVPAQGGPPAPVTTVDPARAETFHHWPVFLPGGRRFVYLVAGRNETAGIYLGTLDGGERRRLVGDPSSPGYAEGAGGQAYLLFARAGTLMAQPFDAGRGRLSGEAFPVAERVGVEVRGQASFSLSGNGTLVYDSRLAERVRLGWMDRAGKRLEWVGEPASGPLLPRLSPDEKLAAFSAASGQSMDVWVRDLVRGTSTRFTFHPGVDSYPSWSPDGSPIVFSSNREGALDLYVKSTLGAGNEELLLKTGNNKFAGDWAGGGRLLLYGEVDANTGFDLWVLPMDGERKPVAFLRTEFNERNGTFSPDGKWIAYSSDESGRFEVYVQPYPATGAKWQVSKDGGWMPRWRRDGKELYWLDENGTLVAEVRPGPTFRPGIPQPLVERRITADGERFDVSGDGKRFLMPMPTEETAGGRPVTVVQNWLAGAKR